MNPTTAVKSAAVTLLVAKIIADLDLDLRQASFLRGANSAVYFSLNDDGKISPDFWSWARPRLVYRNEKEISKAIDASEMDGVLKAVNYLQSVPFDWRNTGGRWD